VIEKPILIIKKPNTFLSLVEDVFTFGGWIALLWFNHMVLDGNGWLDFLFVILWLMTVGQAQSHRVKRFATSMEAVEWLKGNPIKGKEKG
jgi:hypothetical protein